MFDPKARRRGVITPGEICAGFEGGSAPGTRILR